MPSPLRIVATDFYDLHSPSYCQLRLYLKEQGAPAAAPDLYAQALMRLGMRHEQAYKAGLEPQPLDLRRGSDEARVAATLEAVKEAKNSLYRPFLAIETTLPGLGPIQVAGEPDFIILGPAGYAIRDTKISKAEKVMDGETSLEKDHPDIYWQLQAYAWLFERLTGAPPAALEMVNVNSSIITVPYGGPAFFEAELLDLARVKGAKAAFYEPVGSSKCGACEFKPQCWPAAEKAQDVSLIYELQDQHSRALHDAGITTVKALAAMDEVSLAKVIKTGKDKKPGKTEAKVLRYAEALVTGKAIPIQKPDIPVSDNYVMFDIEGSGPPALPDLVAYLWGTQVFGKAPGAYNAAIAPFTPTGDQGGWQAFLATCNGIFDQLGEIPFIHWATYEKTLIDKYMKRFGDDAHGTGARVLAKLHNLFPTVKNAVALPIKNYSLKTIEVFIGYKRTQEEFGGTWSMAKYLEALETSNQTARDEIMTAITTYNREDLESMWKVFEWAQKLGRPS